MSDMHNFIELILKYREDRITDSELEHFKALLRSNPNARKLYVETLVMHSVFAGRKSPELEVDTSFLQSKSWDAALWNEFAEYEKTACRVDVVADELQPVQAGPAMEKGGVGRTLHRRSLITVIASAAALMLLVLYARYAPPRQYGYQVAVLSDNINAKWADTKSQLVNGDAFVTSARRWLLREGYAELLFENNTRVTLEGPSEFQILTGDQIRLNYGRLYAVVPQEAIGFMVKTPSAQIVDLGTEFGVDTNFQGDTSVHVTAGRTMMIAGDQSNKLSVEIGKGDAKRIAAGSLAVSDVAYHDQLFVRDIDSANQVIWNGQTTISLADIVGGGNGFGTGTLNAGVDATTGKMVRQLPSQVVQLGGAGYRKVDKSPFIDGVFIPGRDEGLTPITADGSVAVEFPGTSGNYWGYIFNGAYHDGEEVVKHNLKMNGTVYGLPDTPAITIHSNQGITFDLSKVRRNVPVGRISQFRSLIGISETVKTYIDHSAVVFWVFVDGREVCRQKMSSSDQPTQLNIPIAAADRFLTLAVTESDDTWGHDWALFGFPELVFETQSASE